MFKTSIRTFVLITFLVAMQFTVVPAFAANKPKISLKPIVSTELVQFFESANVLHDYLFEGKDPLVTTQISHIKGVVNKVKNISKVEGQKGTHLNRMLDTINKELNLAQSVSGHDRIQFLQKAYHQIVTLYQSYEITKKYSVFFCSTDRSVWIQQDNKPRNPFQPSSRCGRKIQ